MNIKSLHGAEVLDENGANPDVVEVLEEALAAARRGELRACLVIAVDGGRAVHTRTAIPTNYRHSIMAGTVYAQNDLGRID